MDFTDGSLKWFEPHPPRKRGPEWSSYREGVEGRLEAFYPSAAFGDRVMVEVITAGGRYADD
jgi:hypothetical protein